MHSSSIFFNEKNDKVVKGYSYLILGLPVLKHKKIK